MNNQRKQTNKKKGLFLLIVKAFLVKLKRFCKRFKWENLFLLIAIPFDFYCMYYHLKLNGFYEMIALEPIVYGVMTFGVRYIIKDMRINTKEWFSMLFDNND